MSLKGQYIFDVAIEEEKLNNIDIYSETKGRSIALVKTVSITGKDGQLDIRFIPRA